MARLPAYSRASLTTVLCTTVTWLYLRFSLYTAYDHTIPTCVCPFKVSALLFFVTVSLCRPRFRSAKSSAAPRKAVLVSSKRPQFNLLSSLTKRHRSRSKLVALDFQLSFSKVRTRTMILLFHALVKPASTTKSVACRRNAATLLLILPPSNPFRLSLLSHPTIRRWLRLLPSNLLRQHQPRRPVRSVAASPRSVSKLTLLTSTRC